MQIFFINTTRSLGVHDITIEEVVLPLAISFFTFQQITFLVDAFRNEIKECDFTDYALFVTFFPQLIAGPIVHQSEMMQQFQKDLPTTFRFGLLLLGQHFS